MGKEDTASQAYFSDNARFADLVNGICFRGEQIIAPDDLKEADRRQKRRTRDVAKKVAFGVNFVIVGEESQETVDYSMALRVMESDLHDYQKQSRAINRETKRLLGSKDVKAAELTSGERLYCYPKDARIKPVVTIVLSNTDQDGPECLMDMLDLTDIPDSLKGYISDYRLNIVRIPRLSKDETALFRTDLRQVLDVMRCRGDKEALSSLLKNGDDYASLDPEAYDMLRCYVNLDKYGISVKKTEEGRIDMRDAFDEIHDDGVKEGIEKGISLFILDKLNDHVGFDVIKERLVSLYGIKPDEADAYIEKYAV